MPNRFSRVEDLVGNTPLVALRRVTEGLPLSVLVLAKLECHNPGGSVKDRAALNMIREGMRNGLLTPGKSILDATSGHTGLAYAMLGVTLGHGVTLCVPGNVSRERLTILRAYRANVILTDPAEGIDGAIREARALYAREPQNYFYPDQYSNPANWQAHYQTTGHEIWRQTEGRITHFVAGLGTSGTMMGTGRRLREYNPAVQLVSCQPDFPFHGLEGWKHMASAMVPAIYDPALCDRNMEIATEDAQRMALGLARREGLMVSPSSAAACVGALRLARELDEGIVVVVFPDDASKYLSESFWGET